MGGSPLRGVVSVQVLAEGTVWVLQRASDGARVVLRCAGKAVGGASMAAGTAGLIASLRLQRAASPAPRSLS